MSNVTRKLQQHSLMMQSLLEVLIEETLTANPPTRMMLRRTLAFKQNLKEFEKSVYSIGQAIQNLLNCNQDMADLYLTQYRNTRVRREAEDHEEVELLLEAYGADLQNLHLDLSRMRAALEDTDDFIKHSFKHQTKRNHSFVVVHGHGHPELGIWSSCCWCHGDELNAWV